VTATAGNMGNISPVGYGFSGVWGEAISYYLDGTLQSTINLCGQGSPGYFLHQDCPPGNMFTYAWQSSTTSATHNTTVTATEIIGVQQNLAALDGSNYGCVGSNCAQNSCYYASSCSVTITTNNQNDIIVAFVSDCSSNSQYPNCACLEPQFTSCVFTGLSDSSGLSWNNELYQQCGCGANAGTIYYATASSPVKNDVITLTTSSSSYILSLQVYAFSNTLERFDPNTQNPVSFLCGLQGYPSCSSFSESVPSNYAYDVAFASVYEQECVSYPCTLGGTISALSCCTLMMQDSNRASAAEFRLTSSTGWNPIGFSANLKQSDGELDLMADAIEAKTAICCTTLGDYFDINLNNNKLDSDFRLVPQSTMSTVYVSPGSSITTMITVAGFPDFSGTVSISGSAPSGWGLSFNTTSVSLNPSQHLNVTATISVPSSASLGNHTLTITGTSMIGGLSVTHSINVVAQVVPVILSNNPSSSDWSILKGTWTEKNGVIDATTSSSTTDPIMRSTSTFASDRTVTVRAITITAGSNAYNTAWIGGKYVDSSNSIIMILHTDGKVELQFKQNGVQSSYTTGTTGLSPFVWHTFQMVFSGNTVNAYVDGTLYLTVTNSLVGSLGAANISLESHGAPESQFDSATIT